MIAVVGAGVAGLATTWALARRGEDVTLLEQYEIGHRLGSSHGTSRIFRLSYPEDEWVALAQDAFALWRRLEDESGTQVLQLDGLVDAVHDVEPRAQALRGRGVAFEVVAGSEAEERFGLAYDAGAPLLFQPDAGISLADVALRAFRDAAVARGAVVREVAEARAVRPVDGSVELDLGDERLEADAVVVTAGGWASRLLAPLGVELPVRVTRETVAYFALEDGWTPPSLIDDLTDGPGGSYFALAAPGVGLKAGAHQAGAEAQAGTTGEPDDRLVEAITDWVALRCPRADPRPLSAETCLYTNAPDERFILERHGRLVVGSACSGHGFKFAPAVGERLAGLAVEAAAG